MSGSATPPVREPAKSNTRELIASVIGAVVAMAFGVCLLWLPLGAYIIALGVVGYAVVAYYQPSNWFRRIASTSLGIAGATAFAPAINAGFQFGNDKFGWLVTENAAVTSIGFLVLTAVFGILEYLTANRVQFPSMFQGNQSGCIVIIINNGRPLLLLIGHGLVAAAAILSTDVVIVLGVGYSLIVAGYLLEWYYPKHKNDAT